MADNSTVQKISKCFDAQTSYGRFNDYHNDELNPDIGGALVALASSLHVQFFHLILTKM